MSGNPPERSEAIPSRVAHFHTSGIPETCKQHGIASLRVEPIVSSFRNCENVKVAYFDVSGIAETCKRPCEVVMFYL